MKIRVRQETRFIFHRKSAKLLHPCHAFPLFSIIRYSKKITPSLLQRSYLPVTLLGERLQWNAAKDGGNVPPSCQDTAREPSLAENHITSTFSKCKDLLMNAANRDKAALQKSPDFAWLDHWVDPVAVENCSVRKWCWRRHKNESHGMCCTFLTLARDGWQSSPSPGYFANDSFSELPSSNRLSKRNVNTRSNLDCSFRFTWITVIMPSPP